MKRFYDEPIAEVKKFDKSDIVTASGSPSQLKNSVRGGDQAGSSYKSAGSVKWKE